jgi:hypothetical protein
VEKTAASQRLLKKLQNIVVREGKNGNVSKIDATKTNLLQSKIVVNIAL